MGKAVVLAVALLILGGCSDDKSTLETPDGSTIDVPDEALDAIDECMEQVKSGDAMTAEDVEGCTEATFTVSRDCDGSKLYAVEFSDETWQYREGEPAEMVDPDGPDYLAC